MIFVSSSFIPATALVLPRRGNDYAVCQRSQPVVLVVPPPTHTRTCVTYVPLATVTDPHPLELPLPSLTTRWTLRLSMYQARTPLPSAAVSHALTERSLL